MCAISIPKKEILCKLQMVSSIIHKGVAHITDRLKYTIVMVKFPNFLMQDVPNIQRHSIKFFKKVIFVCFKYNNLYLIIYYKTYRNMIQLYSELQLQLRYHRIKISQILFSVKLKNFQNKFHAEGKINRLFSVQTNHVIIFRIFSFVCALGMLKLPNILEIYLQSS